MDATRCGLNRPLLLLLLSALAACQSTTGANGATPDSKPSPPLTVSLTADTPPIPGEALQLKAAVTTQVAAPDITLTVVLPLNIPLLEGETSWRGSLPAGGTHTLRFSVVVPPTGSGVIKAAALFSPSASVRFSSAAQLRLGPDLPPPPPGKRFERIDGGPVLELPAE